MNFLMPLTIFLAFIPISLDTPIGYISPVDLAIVLMGLPLVMNMSSPRLDPRAKKMLALSFVTYAVWVACCVLNGGPIDPSSLIKYFIFMVAIPIIVAINVPANKKGYFYFSFSEMFSYAGLMLAAIVVLQIARGQALTQSGDSYYVIIANQLVHKNTVGALLVFSTIGAAWCAFRNNSLIHLGSTFFQLMVTLVIGNRSSFLVEGVFVGIVILSAGINRRTMRTLIICGVISILGGAFAYPTGMLDAQIERLTSLGSVNDGELTDASARLVLWDYAWRLIVQQPFLGYGFGNFLYSADDWLDGRIEPHNAFLQIIYAVGIFGFVAFMIMFIIGLRSRNRGVDSKPLSLMIYAYAANAMVGIIWLRGEGHLFWMLFFILSMGYERSHLTVEQLAHASRNRLVRQINTYAR
ncbi:O-antigen ligase family protein [Rhizobium azibense]|uniref:O-antigen ligase n=1 Tax=Rhizobium azibense TaxID=1136135 RepID=A0A4R3RD96_9HYPH|nr:O-antigen ligase family protein [Rhizobium azibense]TCU31282.1 O-antigen ligase [Rhizobium azibense]